MVQLAAHAKSSTLCSWLYHHTSKFFWPDGLLLFGIIIGLRSASSAIIVSFKKSDQKTNFIIGSNKIQKDIFRFVALMNKKKTHFIIGASNSCIYLCTYPIQQTNHIMLSSLGKLP